MPSGILGDAVLKEIHDIIAKHSNKLTHDELKEIADSLIPDLNDLISKQVKIHLIELAQYAIEKFGGNVKDA